MTLPVLAPVYEPVSWLPATGVTRSSTAGGTYVSGNAWVVTQAEFTASWRPGGSPADTVTGKSSGDDSVSNGFTPRRITGSTRR